MNFPNRTGDHPDNDTVQSAELRYAGILTLQEAEGQAPEFMKELLLSTSGDVKTCIRGSLHGWMFERAWKYWKAVGPGIQYQDATKLFKKFGTECRVAGHAGCVSPGDWYHGLAVGHYHVDTYDGLKALADTIKSIVERYEPRFKI